VVDLSSYLEAEDDDAETQGGVAEDFAALKGCLKALADAIASTNLAVITGAQGDVQGAVGRVQASVAALKRFHDAFNVLEADGSGATEEAEDAED
jgi:hypothetical protein